MYEEDGKPVAGECIRCDNTVELNDDGIWQHWESEYSYCPKCWDDSKDIEQQPQFKIQEWHACQDGDMYYIQSDPEDEQYIASFEKTLIIPLFFIFIIDTTPSNLTLLLLLLSGSNSIIALLAFI